ncbi:hypothetical protein [Bacillus sp. T33-2]|uniref:hypothetical protein n=1 Tax=Bacillus sp. T33-2 TaxID=2054168 RepID=UPI000C77B9F3|nr:hypothetical protein [Bacillus sp. T33-2]PLR92663.1 hypothetical protein CVD19_20625 [Bacillus sp. T33-2]
MQYLMTCSTEELALLVTMCDYPHVAKGIAEASLGEKSPEEWEAIMESASRQLMVKGFWDDEKFESGEVPLADEMQEFIKQYVESKGMLRCSDAPRESVLMLHHLEGQSWLSHTIHRDIIHEFVYITNEEIPETIKQYYSFEFDGQLSDPIHFSLSDEAFDLLSDPAAQEKVCFMSDFSKEEQQGYERFVGDLQSKNWMLYNISFFHIPDLKEDPSLENITFFLPSQSGMWMIEYNDKQARPVQVQLAGSDEWNSLLKGISTVTAFAG